MSKLMPVVADSLSGTTARQHRFAALGLAVCLLASSDLAQAQTVSDAAQALSAQRIALRKLLQHNAFARPLVLQSSETSDGLRGDIYALVAFPFAQVSQALQDPPQWCEVMILHLNTKYCHATPSPQGAVLNVNIGTKTPQELTQAARVVFSFAVAAKEPDYFEVLLHASDGPMGTSNVQLALEAVAVSPNQTFLHLSYAYDAYLAGNLAMQAYLAIDSYLAASHQPADQRFEHSLQTWFAASEHYPRQLHEIEQPAYLTMKRAEYARQQTAQ